MRGAAQEHLAVLEASVFGERLRDLARIRRAHRQSMEVDAAYGFGRRLTEEFRQSWVGFEDPALGIEAKSSDVQAVEECRAQKLAQDAAEKSSRMSRSASSFKTSMRGRSSMLARMRVPLR